MPQYQAITPADGTNILAYTMQGGFAKLLDQPLDEFGPARYASARAVNTSPARATPTHHYASVGHGSTTSSMSRRQTKPHVAFMQRRAKHKPRARMNASHDLEYQPIIPDEVEVA